MFLFDQRCSKKACPRVAKYEDDFFSLMNNDISGLRRSYEIASTIFWSWLNMELGGSFVLFSLEERWILADHWMHYGTMAVFNTNETRFAMWWCDVGCDYGWHHNSISWEEENQLLNLQATTSRQIYLVQTVKSGTCPNLKSGTYPKAKRKNRHLPKLEIEY